MTARSGIAYSGNQAHFGTGRRSMANHTDADAVGRYRGRRSRQQEYRLLVTIVFPFFLLFALLGRLLPWRWQTHSIVGGRRRSVYTEAREAAHTVIPIAFMG